MPHLKNAAAEARMLNKLIATEPRLFARLADMHLQTGEVKKAAKLLVKGLQQFPDSLSGWMIKGHLHLHLKQSKLARAAFEKAIAIDAEIPVAHHHCAELAKEEGDLEGYLHHLRALASLEPLDDNIQTMLHAAILRQAAITSGIMSDRQVERMMPGALRQALLRAGVLPPEIARKTERFEFPMAIDLGLPPEPEPPPHVIDLDRTEPVKQSPGRPTERPVWKDPKVAEQIAKQQEEEHDRVVRVSWADALTSPAEAPLVEIDEEQFIEAAKVERDSKTVETPPNASDSNASAPKFEPAPVKPEIPVPAVRPVSLPQQTGPGARKPLIQPYIPPPKSAGVPPARPLTVPPPPPLTPPTRLAEVAPLQAQSMESEWAGATPTPPIQADHTQLNNLPGQEAPKRPRLPADVKLPPMRPLDAPDEMEKPSPMGSVVSRPKLAGLTGNMPDFEPPAPTKAEPIVDITHAIKAEPEVEEEKAPPPPPKSEPEPAGSNQPVEPIQVISQPIEASPEALRPGRDDSAIQRLLQAKREKEPPASPKLTRFETEQEPVAAEPESVVPAITATPLHGPAVTEALEEQESVKPSEATKVPSVEIDDELVEPALEMPKPPAPPAEKLPAIEIRDFKPLSALKPKATLPPKVVPPPPVPLPSADVEEDEEEIVLPPPIMELPPPPPPPDISAREEAVRQKLAAIVEEVTGKAPKLDEPPKPEPQPESSTDYRLKGKIATKTLAELYASQGDWTRAVEVYDVLLEKFPTNEAYRKRLEALRGKLTEG